ncbi:ABC transporter ATP-binding protein [Desulfoferrobacter suflitae]|uniref:ABC transporter ATP-binding protein n=1 Tax=Desulfoferrobacter suflitae TaxID=2865782 RepID=UPI0021642249|nr:ABC transporter ATP-binding protein [Desulfoferrobacter suflitae]MCK8600532.1 ABC transporter ATP-binding protein [Desulfoferrobacter suflitae]
MIRIEKLTKHYKTVRALQGIDLQVAAGELFAYLGPNGSGKTTTIRILTGLSRPTSGDAYLHGFHVEHDTLKVKKECGLVPQTINLDHELTVFENMDIHGRLFHMPARERLRRIDELLEYVEIQERKSSPIKQLSGGMKRRVMVARALMHSPRILFLDEPTVGLDPGIRRRIWSLIKRIQQAGATIFLTTHYIEEAEFLAERVAFLDEGRIIAVDTPHNLMAHLGSWALDEIANGEMETTYFKDRGEANRHIQGQEGSFSLRRVNLEDVFIFLTGKKVVP